MKIIKTSKYIKISERWKDSPGDIVINLLESWTDGVYDDSNDKDISETLSSIILKIVPIEVIKQGNTEMIIDFTSSGYNDPGRTHGPPETSYPPESSDERSVESVKFLVNGKLVGELPKEYIGIVEQEYQQEISQTNIDVYSREDQRADYEFDLGKDEGRF